jgi:thioredoxin reductase (NADPH)
MSPLRVAVVGAGPAGIAAAVQLRRHGLIPLVFERNEPGGLLREARLVENYPGFPAGVSGERLAASMVKHLETAEIEVIRDEVTWLGPSDGVRSGGSTAFVVRTDRASVQADAAIVASGTEPVADHGIAVSDAASRRVVRSVLPLVGAVGERIVIVGGGDAAFDYAVRLSAANDVTVLIRSGEAACIQALRESAEAQGRFRVLLNTRVRSIEETPGGKLAVAAQCGTGLLDLTADHALLAVGRMPSLKFVSSELLTECDGWDGSGEPGRLFLAGDVANGIFRQASIAVGQGVACAMRVAAAVRVAPGGARR